MEEDKARPAKRSRLGRSPLVHDRTSSPVNHASQEYGPPSSARASSLCPENQLGPPPGSLMNGMKPIDIETELFETQSRRRSTDSCSQSSNHRPPLAEMICFGSITSFATSKIERIPCQTTLQTDDGGQLHRLDDTACGRLAQRDVKLLRLFKNEGIEYDILWIPAFEAATVQSGILWVTIYGEKTLCEDLGYELRKVEVYLQDPIHAERDTIYWNPQRFHNVEGLRTTSLEFDSESSCPEVERAEAVDVLKNFTSQDNLPQTEGSASLRTQLKSHQMRALTFMLRREQGWQLDTYEGDIWSAGLDTAGNKVYINNVDNSRHYERPVPFFGGIVADDMGLGKTLSMISLIAHDISLSRARGSTLVVVPPSLLLNWESEIQKHTSPGCISYLSYHGRSRTQGASSFSDFDIVFTTYSTLMRDWTTKGEHAFIFQHHWHRVILDEAHIIKDSTSATFKATRALNADRRWVVTATPIQNHMSELFSLFRFLRLYPYDGHTAYTPESGTPEEATEKLKKLLGWTMLRRLNHILALPDRIDTVIPLELNWRDAEQYQRAKQATIQFLDDMISSETVVNGYMNAISKINTLRMICNLGCCMDPANSASSDSTTKDSAAEYIDSAPVLMDGYSEDEGSTILSSTCVICGSTGSFSPMHYSACGLSGTRSSEMDELSSDDLVRCSSCLSDSLGVMGPPQDCVLESRGNSQVVRIESAPGYTDSSMLFSTKVNALIKDLKAQRQATKSIVFSFWKSSLDLAASALAKEGLTCLQIDGKTPAKQRGGILKHFSELTTEAVLLISLACGAVGLNLTAATRVYLMEPQWNPAIEEQALARVYRLGQTQPVVTVRFFIKESIEEYVRGVQREKRELIDMVLSTGRKKGQKKVTELRNVLAEAVPTSGMRNTVSGSETCW